MLILHSMIPNKTYSGLQSVGYNLDVLHSRLGARNETVTCTIFKNQIPSSSAPGQPWNYASQPLTLAETTEMICREVKCFCDIRLCCIYYGLSIEHVIKLKGHVSSMRSGTTLKQTNCRHIFACLMQDQEFSLPLAIKSIKHVYQTDFWCLKQNNFLTPAIITVGWGETNKHEILLTYKAGYKTTEQAYAGLHHFKNANFMYFCAMNAVQEGVR